MARETPAKRAFPLRLDPETYDALQRWAADEFRSANGQIEFLLHAALRRAGRLPGKRRIKTIFFGYTHSLVVAVIGDLVKQPVFSGMHF